MQSQEKQTERTGKIVAAASIIASGTFLSRILGFLRDMLFANILGAGSVADAFYVAYRIPNLLRELFAEGSMSAGFIPVFTEYLTKKGKEEARHLVQAVFTILFFLLIVIIALGIAFAPLILTVIAPGFVAQKDQFALTITLTRIMIPFLLFISFAALTMGILNSLHRFGPPALSSALSNLVMIVFILLPADRIPFLHFDQIIWAAIGVVVGGLFQWLLQMPTVHQEGFSLSFRWPIFPLHPGLMKIAKLLLPSTLALSVTQINILVNTLVASTLAAGSVSYLYYAMRLIHFPLGIFGVALATALLPTLSAHAARQEMTELREQFSFGLRLIFFITAPAMIGLIFLRVPLVHLLFEHGAFSQINTQGTAQAILYYALGLWAFAGVRVVVQVFYAMQETKTPFFVAIFAMLLNILLSFTLVIPLQHGGLALATSLSAIFNFLTLILLLRKKIGTIGARQILTSHLKTIIASLCMAPLCILIANLPLWMIPGSLLTKIGLVAISVTASAAIYFFVQIPLKSEELIFMKNLIKTRLKRNK